jgi:hypothetical protein
VWLIDIPHGGIAVGIDVGIDVVTAALEMTTDSAFTVGLSGPF